MGSCSEYGWGATGKAGAETDAAASARLEELGDITSDAVVLTGSASSIADRLLAWHALGIEGFRLRPLVLPTDLTAIVDELRPLLPVATSEATTLREHLGFDAVPQGATR